MRCWRTSAGPTPRRCGRRVWKVARRNQFWTEIENDLVPRLGGRWLVSASSDRIYQRVRGTVFLPYSVTEVADRTELSYYVSVQVPGSCSRNTRSPSSTAVCASNRAVAGEDFDDFRPAIYDELECKLGYRVDHHNFQQANTEASRTPLEHYDEYVAAKRATSGTQVLIRPGIGQVLAVR